MRGVKGKLTNLLQFGGTYKCALLGLVVCGGALCCRCGGLLMLPQRLERSGMISPPAPRGEPLRSPCSNSLWRQQEGRSGLMRAKSWWAADWMDAEGFQRLWEGITGPLNVFFVVRKKPEKGFAWTCTDRPRRRGARRHCRPCLYLCLPTYPSSHTYVQPPLSQNSRAHTHTYTFTRNIKLLFKLWGQQAHGYHAASIKRSPYSKACSAA